jgi:hypothetical protein
VTQLQYNFRRFRNISNHISFLLSLRRLLGPSVWSISSVSVVEKSSARDKCLELELQLKEAVLEQNSAQLHW